MSWITREEALARLGVRAQTLYSYVSRGQVDRQPDPDDPRRSLYRADDLSALVRRRARVRKPKAVAASTIDWGEPIIDTALTTITHGRLYYRGQDAVELSRTADLETIAALLWNVPGTVSIGGDPSRRIPRGAPRETPLVALARAAGHARPTHGRSPEMLAAEAGGLVADLAGALGATGDRSRPIHQRFAARWSLGEEAGDVVRRALVLLADQELSTSAFAARVTASTGASLAACALSGLAALSGPLHGDATTRVRDLMDEVERSGPDLVVERYVATGLALPGFGHPLYPAGDPRAAELLHRFDVPTVIARTVDKAREVTGREPTIDVALVALAERYRLPTDAPFSLFALGRSVGWMAHAIEQVHTGTLIRPRARYTGPAAAVTATR